MIHFCGHSKSTSNNCFQLHQINWKLLPIKSIVHVHGIRLNCWYIFEGVSIRNIKNIFFNLSSHFEHCQWLNNVSNVSKTSWLSINSSFVDGLSRGRSKSPIFTHKCFCMWESFQIERLVDCGKQCHKMCSDWNQIVSSIGIDWLTSTLYILHPQIYCVKTTKLMLW